MIIAVSEGVRWYNDKTEHLEMVYASSEVDEFGHPQFGGISGVVAAEISRKTGLDARSQISGYYARSGDCSEYDRKLTSALADKVVDLLLREEYGKMPVIKNVVKYKELEEYNTSCVDMGAIGNRDLPSDYYDENSFRFNDAYADFLSNIVEKPIVSRFDIDFPIVIPK